MLYVHLMEYYLAVKGSDLPTQPTLWVNLENIVLNERNHSRKATQCVVSLTINVQKSKFIGTESRLVVDGGKRGRGGGDCSQVHGFLLG